MLRREGAEPHGLSRSDFIIFMGGTDVDPGLYGEPTHPRTMRPNKERDRIEAAIYCSTPDQYRIGICRGAQLLHILNGGKLWQHVENHLGPHDVLYTTEKGVSRVYHVSSTHHQMMRLGDETHARAEIWAWADQTRRREFHNAQAFPLAQGHYSDPEVVRYKDTNTLCFQPHPEQLNPRDTLELFVRCLTRMVEN
jgi:GMP synthase-like glutamine amidotransferase